jgi:hypothetical protein
MFYSLKMLLSMCMVSYLSVKNVTNVTILLKISILLFGRYLGELIEYSGEVNGL